jgi:uncharacterized protein YcbX
LQPQLQITRLRWTPFKSLALHDAEALELGLTGVADDRRFFLIDKANRIVNGNRFGSLATVRADWDGATLTLRLLDGSICAAEPQRGEVIEVDWELGYRVPAHLIEGPWAGPLEDIVGRPVRVVETLAARPAWSQHPVSLIGRASIDALGGVFGDARRFRMLIEVDGGDPFAEDAWIDHEVRLGGTAVVVPRIACARCAVTTRDPTSGIRDHDALRAMMEVRGVTTLGIYADVKEAGTVRVGDAVVPR